MSARESLVSEFESLDSWEDRYTLLIDLGKELDPLPAELRTPGSKVHGCQSQVWLIPHIQEDGTLHFLADSDSVIVRGLIAVLQVIFSGLTCNEISELDISSYMEKLGFEKHFTAGRRNGLNAIIKRIREVAVVCQDGN